MPKRFVAFIAIGVVALSVAGYLVFSKVSELEDQVAGLGRQLTQAVGRVRRWRVRARLRAH